MDVCPASVYTASPQSSYKCDLRISLGSLSLEEHLNLRSCYSPRDSGNKKSGDARCITLELGCRSLEQCNKRSVELGVFTGLTDPKFWDPGPKLVLWVGSDIITTGLICATKMYLHTDWTRLMCEVMRTAQACYSTFRKYSHPVTFPTFCRVTKWDQNWSNCHPCQRSTQNTPMSKWKTSSNIQKKNIYIYIWKIKHQYILTREALNTPGQHMPESPLFGRV